MRCASSIDRLSGGALKPRFSIIIVDCDSHTPRKAARRGINSILSQTFRDFEVIFVHNGLKKKPYEQEFDLRSIRKVKTIYIKETVNDWGNTSRNYGMRIADGEYILNFNIDNLLYPRCLEKVNECLDRDNVRKEVVIFTIIHHKNAERILTGNPVQFQHIDCLQLIASRKAWESIGFWHRNEYEADGHLYLELSSKYQLFYIEEILAENF
jgi:cellulose synthase/poly-beta-1,6-N-acetylglucosamine synthase-like glycosyltransferase